MASIGESLLRATSLRLPAGRRAASASGRSQDRERGSGMNRVRTARLAVFQHPLVVRAAAVATFQMRRNPLAGQTAKMVRAETANDNLLTFVNSFWSIQTAHVLLIRRDTEFECTSLLYANGELTKKEGSTLSQRAIHPTAFSEWFSDSK